jgi:hypothetical protein
MLTLPIKKKWFDLIKSGEKTTEYREFKKYYETRLKGLGSGCVLKLRNGYSSKSPSIDIIIDYIDVIKGSEQPYLENEKMYFAIRIKSFKQIC